MHHISEVSLACVPGQIPVLSLCSFLYVFQYTTNLKGLCVTQIYRLRTCLVLSLCTGINCICNGIFPPFFTLKQIFDRLKSPVQHKFHMHIHTFDFIPDFILLCPYWEEVRCSPYAITFPSLCLVARHALYHDCNTSSCAGLAFPLCRFRKPVTSCSTMPAYGSTSLILRNPLTVGNTPSYNPPYSHVPIMWTILGKRRHL